ncbi:hypothetical protein H257_14666 [Aphanomyces astaci]|uniref:Uncharacterized protein n=1 Tax=Aphanomyces astaci TaxID=112090 RepID=W4FSP6_APHAT|nr:hypothetical protein H257_14666 [Aphanomyces astaci]ETV69643.1 hypothetical protein H257_14666 [Aphanomyces astaci]|eukprot:XP_009840859.1 hypothetical protein H257_14666 [Aphanomyces astaci]
MKIPPTGNCKHNERHWRHWTPWLRRPITLICPSHKHSPSQPARREQLGGTTPSGLLHGPPHNPSHRARDAEDVWLEEEPHLVLLADYHDDTTHQSSETPAVGVRTADSAMRTRATRSATGLGSRHRHALNPVTSTAVSGTDCIKHGR